MPFLALKKISVIVTVLLSAATVAVLIVNFQSIITTPVPNTWVWWIGDETWLLAQSKQFALTGHYINPLAPGSSFGRCSGLLFGSCYVSALIYGIPQLFNHSSTIELGRIISFLIGIATLIALWRLTKKYNVPVVLRSVGLVLLSSTLSFFMASHSARNDLLVGLVILIATGILPFAIDRSNAAIVLGIILPFGFLVNGHVVILLFILVCYALLSTQFRFRQVIQIVASTSTAVLLLLLAQVLILGSTNVFGPFSGSAVMMPITHILHLKTDITNLESRVRIAWEWAPGVLNLGVVTLLFVSAKIRSIQLSMEEKRLLISSGCVVVSAAILEFYWERYFIFVLPAIVLALMVLVNVVLRTLINNPKLIFTGLAALCLGFGLWSYHQATAQLTAVGDKITNANIVAVKDALNVIHSSRRGLVRVFATVPAEAVGMDDSCTLITPVMFVAPVDTSYTREQLWNDAHIQFAIVCDAFHRDRDWDDVNTHIYGSNSKVIFQRIGPFSDIGRSDYDPADLKNLDTLRVYEFEN